MNYRVKANELHEFDISSGHISNLDVISTSKNSFHILKDNKSFKAEIIHSDFNKKEYTVAINNTPFKISIEDELDLLIKSMGFEIGAKKQINEIHAPMPGLVLEINVAEGQSVQENDILLILEAMKMENSIQSPIDGVIKSIHVTEGDAVEKSQLLIEFE